jgi:hypothetical protein
MIRMDEDGAVMRVVYDGRMYVSYGQAYVESLDSEAVATHEHAFAGQINGLLGAGEPGALYLTTGLHTGDVGFRLVIADGPTPLEPEWEDVVEASFAPRGECAVVQWAGEGVVCHFNLVPGPYRVRYSARQMDAGNDVDVVGSDEPVVDQYELVFWPAGPAPEQIVRQTSKSAAYWHDARNFEKVRSKQIRTWWGDEPPGERLIDVPQARWLVRRARDLAEAVTVAGPAVQRALAVWAARRSCEQVGIDQVEKVARLLQIQGRNEILPPGTGSRTFVEKARHLTEKALGHELRGREGSRKQVPVRNWAIAALWEADGENPLLAAVQALTNGAQVFEQNDVFLSEAQEFVNAVSRSTGTAAPDPRHDPWHGDFRARSRWGDEPPHPRLIEVSAYQLNGFDRGLAERLAQATPAVQRVVARWAARRACTAAGLTAALPGVALALAHLDRGEALSPPFDNEDSQWRLLQAGGRKGSYETTLSWKVVDALSGSAARGSFEAEVPKGAVPARDALTSTISVDGEFPCSRAHFTLPVIRQAAEDDPLRAATQAVWTAACSFGDEYRRAFLKEASDSLLVLETAW